MKFMERGTQNTEAPNVVSIPNNLNYVYCIYKVLGPVAFNSVWPSIKCQITTANKA